MADEKTRVIRRAAAPAAESQSDEPPIVFFCPSGHRIKVPQQFAGKRGRCSTCGATVQIPTLDSAPAAMVQPAAEEPVVFPEPVVEQRNEPAIVVAAPPPSPPPDEPAAGGDDGDWNFISGIDAPRAPVDSFAGAWDASAMPPPAAADAGNPMARLLARLWAEREHGGIIEVHLAGGAVILPEEFASRWSGGTHGVFASQAADGTVTLTAVAWETVQRIVVRHLSAVPGDMFE